MNGSNKINREKLDKEQNNDLSNDSICVDTGIETRNMDSRAEQKPLNLEDFEEYRLLKDSLLRSVADNENLRKRFEKEKEDLLKYSINKFALDMLSVADSLDLAIGSLNGKSDAKHILDGLMITQNQVLAAFKKHHIEKISAKPGDKFDSSFHEAMMEESAQNLEKGTIAKVMQNGYTIHSRLLRPAMVSVVR